MKSPKRSFISVTVALATWVGGIPLVVSAQAPTPTHIWSGASILNDLWDNGDNWVGTAPANNLSTTVLGFGVADSYNSENAHAAFRVRNLIFGEGAGAYILSGESINVHGTGGVSATLSTIYNLSQYQQTIQNDLYFTVNNTTFDTGAAGILWTGNAESSIGTGAFTLNKRGSGELILRGNLITDADPLNEPSYNKLTWSVQKGTLVMDASAAGFAVDDSNNVTLSGGNLRVVGSDTGTTTVNLGTFGALNSIRAVKLIVDSNGGAGTTVNFNEWAMGHTGSPGRTYAFRAGILLNFDLTSGNSTVSMGTIRQQNGANWYSPLTNGVITYATVTDGVKTGFATVVGGDEYGNGGTIARYAGFTPLVASPSNTGNYSLSGNFTVSGGSFYTITIQGAGTLSGSGPATRLSLTTMSAILMEEGVGDYYMNVPHIGNGTLWRIYNYSTDGDLIINSTISGGANYANHSLATGGPGTIVLNAVGGSTLVGSPGDGALNVLEGRLVSNGDQLSVSARVNVYDGTLAGRGQIGGGLVFDWNADPRWIPDSVRYTQVVIHNGGTLDASNVGQKALDITGNLTLDAESTYYMELAQSRGAALSVTSDPSLAPEVASVTLSGDLALELTYAPSYNEWIVLLTTDGLISGQFLTINGESFMGEGNMLALKYNSKWYEFAIAYDHDLGGGITAVALHAIPEPSTIALLSGLGLFGLVYMRRRKVG